MTLKNKWLAHGFGHSKLPELFNTFAQNFIERGETGAAVAVFHKAKPIAHFYGEQNSINGPWQEDERLCTMSACKGMLALVIHVLVARKQLELDTPISHYWPAFAQNGKYNITTRMVLTHTAGLPIIRQGKPGDLFNWQQMIKLIEQSKPEFLPQTKLVYHALTYGFILGELIRRIDGRSATAYFHQEIAQPFDIQYDLSLMHGQHQRQIDDTSYVSKSSLAFFSKWLSKIPYWKLQFFRQCNENYRPNSQVWQRSEIPAVTGQGTAVGLAKAYAILANQGQLNKTQLLPADYTASLFDLQLSDKELTSSQRWNMGLGFILNSSDMCSLGPNANTMGHLGMGGAIGFADKTNNLSFAYVTEKYHTPTRHDKSMAGLRVQGLIEALYRDVQYI